MLKLMLIKKSCLNITFHSQISGIFGLIDDTCTSQRNSYSSIVDISVGNFLLSLYK